MADTCAATALGHTCALPRGHDGLHREDRGGLTTWPEGWGQHGRIRLATPPTPTCPTCRSSERRVLLEPCARMQEYQWIDGYGDGPDEWHLEKPNA